MSDPAHNGGSRPDHEPAPRKPKLENYLDAHGHIIDLWTYEGASFWSKFNAFVVGNSIILGGASLGIT
jgi:hypothetical protein